MKAEQRDLMVKRVKEFSDLYPTFESVPVGKTGPITFEVTPENDQQKYIAALHEVCAQGIPVGRSASGGILFGGPEVVVEEGKKKR